MCSHTKSDIIKLNSIKLKFKELERTRYIYFYHAVYLTHTLNVERTTTATSNLHNDFCRVYYKIRGNLILNFDH